MPRRAGELHYQVHVQSHTGTVREGEKTVHRDEDWPTVIPALPVSYKDVSGGETIRGRQMEPNSTGVMEAAWSPSTAAITKHMRLKGLGLLENRIFNVVNVMDLEGRRKLVTIQVEEKR